jgi:tetratricopeptide (TPR) repeat protein
VLQYTIGIMLDDPEALIAAGYGTRREGRPNEAKELFSDAVTLCQASGDQTMLAKALTGLGQIERDLKNTQESLRYYRAAEAIYRGLADPLRLAHTVRHIGDILREDGSLDQARPCYEEALRIYREQEQTPPLDLANAIRGFALLRAESGEREQAKSLWQEARSLYQSEEIQAGVRESDAQIELLSRN